MLYGCLVVLKINQCLKECSGCCSFFNLLKKKFFNLLKIKLFFIGRDYKIYEIIKKLNLKKNSRI